MKRHNKKKRNKGATACHMDGRSPPWYALGVGAGARVLEVPMALSVPVSFESTALVWEAYFAGRISPSARDSLLAPWRSRCAAEIDAK
jgi:hypothetical protein